ncbi:hypothetical protein CAPTEDRAFT_228408 [Capitella teleta]|uniref:BTB domain-containing protein n=1 Tax=Capitella teleta TaxID=283909 RepID=R7VEY4_CAPTE|nr:hypothetical protein CAPTEDRAFT_228408 [Capitella teleta]|eukprot:ELU17164.1 hypothetical protein CAPTEDRAFT_228408 [Capitella teleta]
MNVVGGLSLHLSEQGDSVLRCLNQQRTHGRFCDVTLLVSGHSFAAHRNVLAACSPFFNSIFRERKSENESVTLQCKDHLLFESLLEFLYTGQITVDQNSVQALTEQACELGLERLVAQCVACLESTLHAANCYQLRDFAIKCHLENFLKTIEAFLITNIPSIIHQNEILEFPLCKLENLLVTRSAPLTEEDKLVLICRWTKYLLKDREKDFVKCLSHLNWGNLGFSQLNALIHQDELFVQSEWCLFSVLQALEENHLLFDIFSERLTSLRMKFISNDLPAVLVDTDISPAEELLSGHDSLVVDLPTSEDDEDSLPIEEYLKKKLVKSRRTRSKAVKNIDQEEESPSSGKKRKLEPLSCDICPYSTLKGEERLRSHITKNHADDRTFSCPKCEFSCKWNREYNQHLKEHFKGPPFMCDIIGCTYKADRMRLLLEHRTVHTNERPFKCSECHLQFRTQANLYVHRKTHTGEKRFVCSVCSRRFSSRGNLQQHSVIHSAARPFLCDLCGFSTKYQSHLKSHRRTHTGEVFSCQYSGCTYSTPKRSQLACHMRCHLKIRDHVCTVCSQSFTEKSHLTRHMRIHSNDKPFACNQCEYKSTRLDKLKDHQEKYHNPEAKKEKKQRKGKKARTDDAVTPRDASTVSAASIVTQAMEVLGQNVVPPLMMNAVDCQQGALQPAAQDYATISSFINIF